MKITRQRLMEMAGLNESLEGTLAAPTAASEVLSMLAHPDLKKSMETLADMLEDAEYMAIKKLYDGLYNEVKKYE